MALNIGQFMTREEVLEGVDDSLWFAAYSHSLQRVGEAMQTAVGMASGKDARGRSVPTGPCILGRNWHPAHHVLRETLLGASPERCIQKEGEGLGSLCNYLCG